MNSNNLMGLLEGIKKINLSSVVTNTNKTLNIVKKAIPVYREIKPYVSREKKIFNKKEPEKEENIKIKESTPFETDRNISYSNDSLTFFQ